ncbi:MAG: sugar transferase [Planctomycetes bacterium]|nr:sugar transferase [Planctomycetota bacterium]
MTGLANPTHPYPYREARRRLAGAILDVGVVVGGWCIIAVLAGHWRPSPACGLAPVAAWVSMATMARRERTSRWPACLHPFLYGLVPVAWLGLLLALDGSPAPSSLLPAWGVWAAIAILWMGIGQRIIQARRPSLRLVTAGRREAIEAFIGRVRMSGTRVEEIARLAWDGPPSDGQIRELAQRAEGSFPDAVVLCSPRRDQGNWQALLAAMRRIPVPIYTPPAVEGWDVFMPGVESLGGADVVRLVGSNDSIGKIAAKMALDKVVAIAAILSFSWLFVLVAIAVAATSRGPVFYTQRRHGIGGRVISVIKFRTMVCDAPANPPAAGFDQPRMGDPRFTAVGPILRRTSLDEIPQFLNVLIGDMSVVGPRPHAIAHNEAFMDDIPDLMRRHFVLPGITGLAQIGGARGETRTVKRMSDRLALDLEYVHGNTVWGDIRVILVTGLTGFINSQP